MRCAYLAYFYSLMNKAKYDIKKLFKIALRKMSRLTAIIREISTTRFGQIWISRNRKNQFRGYSVPVSLSPFAADKDKSGPAGDPNIATAWGSI
jgi:hypothetical protein